MEVTFLHKDIEQYMNSSHISNEDIKVKKKGKAIPVTVRGGP
jgi:hypothetical protein